MNLGDPVGRLRADRRERPRDVGSHLLDRHDPGRRAAPRRAAHAPAATPWSITATSLIILTNADGAEDFKIVTAPLAGPDARTGATSFPTGRA